MAQNIGESIQKNHQIPSTGIYFENVTLTDPADPDSQKIGMGRFHAELWVLSWFGVDFTSFKKAQLVAVRFFFDALFPFLLLFLISYISRPIPENLLDRFYTKLHTPVQPTEEEEKRTLEENYRNPERLKRNKIWPHSNWEIHKPGWMDFVGFFGSWALVGIIILLLKLMTSIK